MSVIATHFLRTSMSAAPGRLQAWAKPTTDSGEGSGNASRSRELSTTSGSGARVAGAKAGNASGSGELSATSGSGARVAGAKAGNASGSGELSTTGGDAYPLQTSLSLRADPPHSAPTGNFHTHELLTPPPI